MSFLILGRVGGNFVNITPETWTDQVTEDLRQAYKDENTKINVNCQGYNNQPVLVSFVSFIKAFIMEKWSVFWNLYIVIIVLQDITKQRG